DLIVEMGQGSLENRTGQVIPAGQGLSAQVMASRQIYVTSHLHAEANVFMPQLLENVRCAAVVPLVTQEKSMGVLWVTRDEREDYPPAPFFDSEIRLLVAVADIVANAIQRVSLHEKTMHY